MPDIEMVMDDLRLYAAKTPEDRARAEGFIAGKKFARLEILYLMIFFFVVGLIIWITASAL